MNKSIYIKPINGLCNRLFLINSVYSFSNKYNFDIKICWKVSEGFSDETFDSLFDISYLPEKITFIDEKEYKEASSKLLNLEDYFKQNKISLEYNFFVEKRIIFEAIKNKSFCYNSFLSLDWVFHEYTNKSNLFIEKHIKPNKELKHKIEKIKKEYNGIHIRRNDIFKFPRKDKYLESKEEYYEKIIEKDKEEKFFLSTDDFEIKKNFKNKYPKQIYTNEIKKEIFEKEKIILDEKFKMDCKPFQKQAVLDLFCLSKTKKIYGNNWSTFSEVASILEKKDLEIVRSPKCEMSN